MILKLKFVEEYKGFYQKRYRCVYLKKKKNKGFRYCIMPDEWNNNQLYRCSIDWEPQWKTNNSYEIVK